VNPGSSGASGRSPSSSSGSSGAAGDASGEDEGSCAPSVGEEALSPPEEGSPEEDFPEEGSPGEDSSEEVASGEDLGEKDSSGAESSGADAPEAGSAAGALVWEGGEAASSIPGESPGEEGDGPEAEGAEPERSVPDVSGVAGELEEGDASEALSVGEGEVPVAGASGLPSSFGADAEAVVDEAAPGSVGRLSGISPSSTICSSRSIF
jgi:hypothetical protein